MDDITKKFINKAIGKGYNDETIYLYALVKLEHEYKKILKQNKLLKQLIVNE